MNKLKNNPLILSIIINLNVLVCMMIIFQPCYETSDDMFMNEFASGIFGQQENHLVFINYILGNLMQGLYRLFPLFNWYTILQYIFMYVSFVVITYVLIQTKGNVIGVGVSTIILVVFGYQGYVCPQFSKTAGFYVYGRKLFFVFC